MGSTSSRQNNKNDWIEKVRRHVWDLKYAPDNIKDDKEIVVAAVQRNGRVLEYASERLRNDKDVVIVAVAQSRWAFKFAPDILQNDRDIVFLAATESARNRSLIHQMTPGAFYANKDIVLAAVRQNGKLLKFASEEIQSDERIALAAVSQNGHALQFVSNDLRSKKDIVMAAVHQDGSLLKLASENLRSDKDIVLAAVSQDWRSLHFASDSMKNDRDIIIAAIRQNGLALGFASDSMKNDKDIVKAAVHQSSDAFHMASNDMKNDRDVAMIVMKQRAETKALAPKCLYASNAPRRIFRHFISRQIDAARMEKQWMQKVEENGWNLVNAPDKIKRNKNVVMHAVRGFGLTLEFASCTLKDDKDVVIAAVRANGSALQHASGKYRSTKEVVLTAVQRTPASLKYALGGLNQDHDCLAMAGLFDNRYERLNNANARRAVMSTKFSLGENTTDYATKFALLLKKHPLFFKKIILYFPNSWDKNTCDPEWTDIKHPCRGTFETCEKSADLKTGVPKKECCWRYSFRYQLEKAKETGGFMIQLAEYFENKGCHILGDGQKIEVELAEQVGVKIFRIFQRPNQYADKQDIEGLIALVRAWNSAGCKDNSITEYRLQRR